MRPLKFKVLAIFALTTGPLQDLDLPQFHEPHGNKSEETGLPLT